MTKSLGCALAVVAIVVSTEGLCRAAAPSASPSAEVCFDDALRGQKLRDAGKLIDARARLIACASRSCPAEVTKDCSRWLNDVEAAVPTLVFVVQDADGADLGDVDVFVDGVLAGKSIGRTASVDPGPHELRFVRGNGNGNGNGKSSINQSVVAHAGEKNRAIVVRFAPPTNATTTTTSTAETTSRPIPTGSWIFGGTALLAFGTSAWFAVSGVSDRSSLGCDRGCSAGDKESVDDKLLIADVALSVGIVALGVAAYFYVTRPRVPSAAAAADFGQLQLFAVPRARRIWK